MAVRKWHMHEALKSYSGLRAILNELTEEEVLAALTLEAASLRRQSFIDRLISRAARLNEINYVNNLRKKYHGNEKSSSPSVQGRTEGQEG